MSQTRRLMRNVVVGYLAIGFVIFGTQTLAGRPCDSLLGERHLVGRGSLAMTVILWPSDLVDHVRSGRAPIAEYFAPTECITD